MPKSFRPALEILPAAQQEIWPSLAPAPELSLVLYGGTAIALQLGHRQSIDFDFFTSEPLRKADIIEAFGIDETCAVLQDSLDTFSVSVPMPSGPVKLSFFGNIGIGRVAEPLQTDDGILLVASLEDLLATKLKAILDRAEVRDYRDLAEILRNGLSLAYGVAAFRTMYKGEPAQVLRAIGYFEDGNLASLGNADRKILTAARDAVKDLPPVIVLSKSLAA